MEIYPKYQPGAYLTSWTLGVERALGHSMSAEVNYLGNHTTNGNMEPDLNEPTVGFSTANALANAALTGGAPGTCTAPCIPGITSAVSRRPYNAKFPYFGNILQYGPGGETNYDALQVTVRNRTTHGLTFNANYSYAHHLSSVAGGNNPTILTITNPELDYGNSGDPFQTFYFTVTYEVPGLKSMGWLSLVTQGWRLNSAFQFQSAPGLSVQNSNIDFAGNGTGVGGRSSHRGQYYWSMYTTSGGSPNDFSRTGFGYVGLNGTECYTIANSNMDNGTCNIVPLGAPGSSASLASNYPLICRQAAAALPVNAKMNAIDPGISDGYQELVGNTIGGVAQQAFGCWVAASGHAAIVAPAQGTFGNMQKNELQTAPWDELDFSVTKDTRIKERFTAEFRAEFFNFLNTPAFTGGDGDPTSPTFSQSLSTPNGGNPVNGNGGQRVIQLGLKFIF